MCFWFFKGFYFFYCRALKKIKENTDFYMRAETKRELLNEEYNEVVYVNVMFELCLERDNFV